MSMTPESRATLAEVIMLISRRICQAGEKKSSDRPSEQSPGCWDQAGGYHADPAALGIAPEAHGMSRGRWANVRSLLGKALAMARPMMPGRSRQAILPAWEALMARLPSSRRVRLLAPLRFLSARGRGPADVTAADFEDYRHAIMNDRLRKDPEKSWDRLVWVWTWCQCQVAGWPAIVIERPSKRVTYVLPWSAFPASFKNDVDFFLRRLSGQDLSEDGPPRPARTATLQKRFISFVWRLPALVHRGHDAHAVRSIADLLSLERYQEILRSFLDRDDARRTRPPRWRHS